MSKESEIIRLFVFQAKTYAAFFPDIWLNAFIRRNHFFFRNFQQYFSYTKMERYYWSKPVLGRHLEITRGNEPIGSVVWESSVGSKAYGTIDGHRFMLNRDFFLSKLEIYDTNNGALLGTIMINLFNPRSEIIVNGKRFELEIKNFWQSRWSWKFNGDELISYQSNEFLSKDKGMIEVYTGNTEEIEILLLLGLFVRNQLILFMLIILLLVIIVIF